ncbi:MAG: signal peptidase II [Gammaproteobacteria bacterium]|nr:signal peptidase II [Gammaproteobacteria bacterium]
MATENPATSPESGVNPTGARLKWLWLSLLVIVLDQAAKQTAEALLTPHQPVAVLPFFDWYLTYNTGAAFSLLADAGGWQRWFFTAIAVVVSVVIVQWLRKLARDEWLTALSLSLILGGAIGNVIDRIYLGYVIDYIQVWLGSYPFPAFNIADSAISVGAVLLILSSFVGNKPSSDEAA